MAIFSNWHKRGKWWGSIESIKRNQFSDGESTRRIGGTGFDNKYVCKSGVSEVYNNRSERSVSIYSNVFGTGNVKSNNNSKSNGSYKRNRYNKCLYPIIALLIASPVKANVGGVSATANPIANSSGSVTNQAIQVLQGPYVTNTYGGGISCQGPTANITPFITHSRSYQDPFERFYYEPQYDGRDVKGQKVEIQQQVKNYPWEEWYDDRVRTDPNDPLYDVNEDGEPDRWFEDGADMTIVIKDIQPDGIPDRPGRVLWDKPVRTGQQDNLSTNIGLSATLSFPLDGGLQERCKAAADTQTQLMRQTVANKRLDFEIARLKNCGELMKRGISFHPKSPYYAICADVVVQNVNTIPQHKHSIPPISSSSVPSRRVVPSSPDTDSQSPLGGTISGVSFPIRSAPLSAPSSQPVSPLLTKDQQEVLQVLPKTLPRQQ